MDLQWHYAGALFGVIGIGWLVVVPMYRGWKNLNREMRERVRRSRRLLDRCEIDFDDTASPSRFPTSH